jgi:hypothetical protein
MVSTPLVKCKWYVDMGEVGFDCSISVRGRKLGELSFEHEQATMDFMRENMPRGTIPLHGNTILLTHFKVAKRGFGKKILCRAIAALAMNHFTHIILNAVPIPGPKRSPVNARAKLIKNYKKLGFRMVDEKSGLMKARVSTVAARCRRHSPMTIDEVALQVSV